MQRDTGLEIEMNRHEKWKVVAADNGAQRNWHLKIFGEADESSLSDR